VVKIAQRNAAVRFKYSGGNKAAPLSFLTICFAFPVVLGHPEASKWDNTFFPTTPLTDKWWEVGARGGGGVQKIRRLAEYVSLHHEHHPSTACI